MYQGTDWELGEHVRNVMRASWELDGNIVGPHCEPKMTEKHTPHPHPPKQNKTQKKKTKSLQPSHWVHKMPISERDCHHFQPGLVSTL